MLNFLCPGDSCVQSNKDNRLYLMYSKQPLPPAGRADPPVALLTRLLCSLTVSPLKAEEEAAEGEWRQAAGPDGVRAGL